MRSNVYFYSRLRLWFVYFLFISTMSIGLSLITPHYGGPDEKAHFVYLYNLFNGSIPMDSDVQDVPEWILDADAACWAFNTNQSAHCAGKVDTSDTSPTKHSTPAVNYPPLYYLLVGWPIKFLSGTTALRAIRFLSSILFSTLAALGLSFLGSHNTRRRTNLLALIMISPSVYVLSGFVQPQALEIGSAIALAGILLPLAYTPEESKYRLKWAIPITFLLVASRTTGMWWALMICILVLISLKRSDIVALIKKPILWIFVTTSALWCSLSLWWTLGTKDWYEFHANRVTLHSCDVFECILPNALESYQFRFMTAVSGHLDAWPPDTYIHLYWMTIAVIVFISLLVDMKKTLIVTFCVDFIYLVSAVILSISWVDIYGGPIWQGRYALPLVVPYLIAITNIIYQSQKIKPPLYRWLNRISSIVLSLLFLTLALGATQRFWSGTGSGIDLLHGPFYAPLHAQIGLALCILASLALCGGLWYATRPTRIPALSPDISVDTKQPCVKNAEEMES